MSGANGFAVKNKSVGTRATRGPIAHPEIAGCGVAIMAKASTPGRAKTRLVPPLNFDEAAAFNTAFLQDVADNVLRARRHGGVAGYVAFGPPESAEFFRRTLPTDIELIDVWLPNFGDCLLLTIEEILRRGHGAAAVLNSDSPTLPTSLLVEATEVLARPGERAVLGPSCDGGYYLLGLKHAHRRLFEDIAWSTDRVAEQTLERAQEINLDVHVLPVWYDVDDAASLRALRAELGALGSSVTELVPYCARHTAALMDRFCRETDFARRIARRVELEELGA